MQRNRTLGTATLVQALACQALSGTGATTSSEIDLSAYDGDVLLLLTCSALGGSGTPTCTYTVTESDESGGTFEAVSGVSKAFTAAGAHSITLNSDKRCRYVKVVATMTGTSPTCSTGAMLLGIARG